MSRERFCLNCAHACLGPFAEMQANAGRVFDVDTLVLQCRRHPPVPSSATRGGKVPNPAYPYHGEQYTYQETTDHFTSFPDVRPDTWCGEWEERGSK